MPVVAAAVCPHPPILPPEISQGASGELDALRSAADAAVAALLGAGADTLFVVGTDTSTVRFTVNCGGSFAPWGLDLAVGAPYPAGPPLPLSLTVGAWLLERAGGSGAFPGGVRYQSVARDAAVDDCAELGRSLAASGPVALLVMGDGSGRRGPGSPGTPDGRAAAFDAEVASALAAGDPARLLALPPALAGELLAAGRAAWQVLAGAVGDAPVRAELRYHEAPYGVGYLVASWYPGAAPPPAEPREPAGRQQPTPASQPAGSRR